MSQVLISDIEDPILVSALQSLAIDLLLFLPAVVQNLDAEEFTRYDDDSIDDNRDDHDNFDCLLAVLVIIPVEIFQIFFVVVIAPFILVVGGEDNDDNNETDDKSDSNAT